MAHGGGTTFAFRLHEESGAPASEIARAYAAARDIFAMRSQWGEIEALDNKVAADMQIRLLLEGRRLVERGSRWLLAHRSRPLDIGATVSFFSPGATALQKALQRLLGPSDVEPLMVEADEYERAGVPPGLAHRVAGLATMFSTFDIVEVAAEAGARRRGGRRRLLQARRAARAALAARPHRRAPARRPLARAGPGRAARRPLQPPPRADGRGAARHGLEGVGRRARRRLGGAQPGVRALPPDAGRDPPRPRLRHDHAAGGRARGAQPAARERPS